ncbi:MAG: hypothetical protein LC808_32665, partial [Actinobacteria bacterium]|nr:hypothetical protein [Actinomycetota bacterium]
MATGPAIPEIPSPEWKRLRSALSHVRAATEEARLLVPDEAREEAELQALARHPALTAFPTPQLDELSRGRWLAAAAIAAASQLYGRVE